MRKPWMIILIIVMLITNGCVVTGSIYYENHISPLETAKVEIKISRDFTK
jgi:hypothetical protein